MTMAHIMFDEDILDDDSFLPEDEGDGPPDTGCGCEDDRDLYDDD